VGARDCDRVGVGGGRIPGRAVAAHASRPTRLGKHLARGLIARARASDQRQRTVRLTDNGRVLYVRAIGLLARDFVDAWMKGNRPVWLRTAADSATGLRSLVIWGRADDGNR
jgi:hypothetical protein